MAKNENYTGNIEMIDGFIPANGNDFPLMDAHYVMTEDGTRLDQKLANMGTGGGGGGDNGSNVAIDKTLTQENQAAEAKEVGDRIKYINDTIVDMSSGGTGYVRKILTINDTDAVKLFVGTQDEYIALSDEDKKDLLAIITDEESMQKLFNVPFEDTNINEGTLLAIGRLPMDKSANDIVGIGVEMDFGHEHIFSTECFSAGKVKQGGLDRDTSSATYGKVIVPFRATNLSLSTKNGLGVSYLKVNACSENGIFYIHFLECQFNSYNLDDNGCLRFSSDYTAKLSDGTATLRNVCYWFA